MRLWQAYTRALHRHPVLVKATTSGMTFGTTDMIAQARRDEAWDSWQTLRNSSFGFCWLGPTNHFFWGRRVGLERWFPGSTWRAAFTRMVVDQSTAMPCNMAAFLAWPALTTGQGIEAAAKRVEEHFVDSVSFALCIWPFVHPVSFKFVPLEHRLLVLNACSLVTFSYATLVSGEAVR